MSKALYVKNLSGFDLNIADLGFRIKAGATVNIYEFNQYLTDDAIHKSLTSGYLFKGTQPDKDGKVYIKILKKPVKKEMHKVKVATIEQTPLENKTILVNPVEHIEDGGFLAVDYGFDTSMTKNLQTNLTEEEVVKVKTLADFFNSGAGELQKEKDASDKQVVIDDVAKTQKVTPKITVVDGQTAVVMQIDETDTAQQDSRPKIKTSKKAE